MLKILLDFMYFTGKEMNMFFIFLNSVSSISKRTMTLKCLNAMQNLDIIFHGNDIVRVHLLRGFY